MTSAWLEGGPQVAVHSDLPQPHVAAVLVDSGLRISDFFRPSAFGFRPWTGLGLGIVPLCLGLTGRWRQGNPPGDCKATPYDPSLPSLPLTPSPQHPRHGGPVCRLPDCTPARHVR